MNARCAHVTPDDAHGFVPDVWGPFRSAEIEAMYVRVHARYFDDKLLHARHGNGKKHQTHGHQNTWRKIVSAGHVRVCDHAAHALTHVCPASAVPALPPLAVR